MLDVLLTAINAVVPIVLLILLGNLLKRVGFLSKDFLKVGNKLVFNVCLPCMLFVNVYDNMDGFDSVPWDVVLYSVVIIFVLFSIGLLAAALATDKRNRRGVILQCAFRSNYAIIGLPLVERLSGDGAVAGIVSAFSIPLFNILAVIALTVFAQKPVEIREGLSPDIAAVETPEESAPKESFSKHVIKILKGIVTNPLIIGVFAGLLFVAVREIERACCGGDVPFRFDSDLKFLYVVASDLKAIASPLALLVLGGQFEFSAVKGMTKETVVATLIRIVGAPLIGVGTAALLSVYAPEILYVPSAAYPTLIALFATPVAVSSAIMAGQMGGDGQLATQLVVWTSVGSIFTVFITVFVLMSCGLVVV